MEFLKIIIDIVEKDKDETRSTIFWWASDD
jgi:hypothetical protein